MRNVRGLMEKAAALGKTSRGSDGHHANSTMRPARRSFRLEPGIESRTMLSPYWEIADTSARLRRVNELLNKEIEVLTVQEINTQDTGPTWIAAA